MKLGNRLVKILSKYLNKQEPAQRSYLCDFDRICHEVRPADVLLIEGRNRVNRFIQRITQSPWSHAALYIGRLHDVEDPRLRELIHKHNKGPATDQLLIESNIGHGTVISPISKYRDDHIRICRAAGISYHDAQKVIEYCVNSIGKEYDLRNFLDLGRFLLGSRFIPRRWKSSLFRVEPGQATQDICTSMIAAAFESIQFPILPLIKKDHRHGYELIHRNPKLFTPSDFDYSPYFNIIKYPILPVSDLAAYRRLPWQEGAIYNDEMGISALKAAKKSEEPKKN